MTDGTNPPTVTPNRVERGASKKRRRPILLFVIPVVLVAIAAVVLLLLRGGDVPILGGGEEEQAPPFDFIVKRARAVPTDRDQDKAALAASAEQVGTEITPTIDDLYTNAFLDPSNWRDGDYEEVFELFAEGAAASAEQNVDTLTLGTAAGDEFRTVSPDKGTLSYEVLFDPESEPNTAVATVVFRATAESRDGTFLAIVSRGEFFLEQTDGWTIVAFDVTREDHETSAPTPSPSTTSSPSA